MKIFHLPPTTHKRQLEPALYWPNDYGAFSKAAATGLPSKYGGIFRPRT